MCIPKKVGSFMLVAVPGGQWPVYVQYHFSRLTYYIYYIVSVSTPPGGYLTPCVVHDAPATQPALFIDLFIGHLLDVGFV